MADYTKNPHFKYFYTIMLVILLIVVGSFAIFAFQPINIPLEVKEAIEILDYPSSGFSLFAGENITFEITIQNLASVTHFVEFDFQLNDTEYQAKYVRFSNYNYSVPTGTQTLSAWVKIAQTAPPANLMLTTNRKTVINDTTILLPSTAPVIDSVSPISTDRLQTIVIKGSGFGNTQPLLLRLDDGSVDTIWGGSTPSIVIYDLTNGLSAGAAGDWYGFTNGPPDLIGIILVSWTDTEIILDGFGTDLSGRFSWSQVQKGDTIQVQIQTIGGIGTYKIEVT